MSLLFKALPPQGLHAGRLASDPRSFQLKEQSSSQKVLGAQLQGNFHSCSSFRALGPEDEQSVITLAGRD